MLLLNISHESLGQNGANYEGKNLRKACDYEQSIYTREPLHQMLDKTRAHCVSLNNLSTSLVISLSL